MRLNTENGILKQFEHDGKYLFRTEETHMGPVFHVVYGGRERFGTERSEKNGWYTADFWGVFLSTKVIEEDGGFTIIARAENTGSQVFRPEHLYLSLGVDTYMDRYPDWNDKVFPTYLRCEKTHFWGYFRSPAGQILGIASPDPVPSWKAVYNYGFCHCGHRIYTVYLDLMTDAALPERNPRIECLLPGEVKEWRITLFDAADEKALLKRCAAVCQAAVFSAERLSLGVNETAEVRIYAPEKPMIGEFVPERIDEYEWRIRLPENGEAGTSRLTAEVCGRSSELIYYRRREWSFYLKAAAQAALSAPQKTGSHCESWYGLFSLLQAARYYGDTPQKEEALRVFEKLLPLSFDTEKGIPVTIPDRIQNTAIAVSLMADAWQLTKDTDWLTKAGRLADYLIDRCRNGEGAFVNQGTHYTSVIYIAKSILELWIEEKDQPGYEDAARKHFEAAKMAVDELVLHLDNIGTEGEHTFEDGMISCSVTQIAMLALYLPENERGKYIEAAETMLRKHRCLERLYSPDARSRNTTLRFWEAQYDVLIPDNMINSPHGWSGWKIYGVYYLYLLTGRQEYLTDMLETLGSCIQLMDLSGKLRWAFVPDPCVESALWVPDGENGRPEKKTFGETYIDMISGWYRAPENTAVFGYLGSYPGFATDRGGCCDNDVHEIFKALEETVLRKGFILQTGTGYEACGGKLDVTEENGTKVLYFVPEETDTERVHVNVSDPVRLIVRFAGGEAETRVGKEEKPFFLEASGKRSLL